MLMLWALGCVADNGNLVVAASPEVAPVLEDFVANLGDARVELRSVTAPSRTAARFRNGVSIELDPDLCAECYAGTADDDGLHLRGGGVLGVQYALADALERRGYGFYHPETTVIPDSLDGAWDGWDGQVQAPAEAIRGLDPHTLHPIEFMQDAWQPSADGLARAERVVDWLIKNRGNHLQYPALNNILDASEGAAWADHTAALVDYAHARGVRMGIGIQLFAGSNLQQAFDLVDDTDATPEATRAQMDDRLRTLLHPAGGPAVAFDTVNLSFGEFSGEDPQTFIDDVDLFAASLAGIAAEEGRAIEPSAVIHVGKGAGTTVTYNGEEMLYYFLVTYADPSIVPYVHTVMYYNLFDDAGGAYQHDDFSEHRTYLLDRLQAGQPVAYFPESAYWCAFDDSVPLYLPVYLKSRWYDMQQIDAAGAPLQQQVTFSSGWEWGYWQTDVAVLHMGWARPDSWEDLVRQRLPVLDPATQDAVIALGDLQYDALITQRLAPWMAGRDIFMDLGRQLDIVSQPDRPTFAELAAMTADERAAFRASVVEPLRTFGAATRALLGPVQAVPDDTRYQREVEDGIEIDALRAEYMTALLDAVLAHADGDDTTAAASIATAEARKTEAQAVVDRRHADLFDPDPERLTSLLDNATIYDYGYLYHADNLCFWERDRVQARALVLGDTLSDPGCGFT